MHRYRRLLKRTSVFGKALYLLCLGSAVTVFTILYTQTWTSVTNHDEIGSGIVELQYPIKEPFDEFKEQSKRAAEYESQVNCQQKHCSEYLTQKEKVAQRKCAREVFRHMDPLNIKMELKENDCHFIDGSQRLPVALVSAEGSGNTWIRGLLEKATGVCTGFLHCDYVMRQSGFIGEGIKSGSVLVVKSHAVEPQWSGVAYSKPNRKQSFFGSAILIVRNPYDCLIAEWNRRVTNLFLIPNGIGHNESHTNTIPKEYWRIPEWDSYVHVYIEAWKERILNWVLQDHAKVHVVNYEAVKRNPLYEVTKMLEFLKVDYVSSDELKKRLSEDFSEFKRPKRKQVDFEHYTPEQKLYIKLVILETSRALDNKYKLESYTA